MPARLAPRLTNIFPMVEGMAPTAMALQSRVPLTGSRPRHRSNDRGTRMGAERLALCLDDATDSDIRAHRLRLSGTIESSPASCRLQLTQKAVGTFDYGGGPMVRTRKAASTGGHGCS